MPTLFVTYLILLTKVEGSEKTAVIDSVKAPFSSELADKIRQVKDPMAVDYIVVNHAEPDHSGAVQDLVKLCPNAKVVTNKLCQKMMGMIYDTEGWNWELVKDKQELSLGDRTLSFITSPMVHWPESMYTYLKEDQILFSMDSFGQHFASNKRFDTDYEWPILLRQMKEYYANILMLFGKTIQRAIKKVAGLPIKIVAPAHGLILTETIPKVLEKYGDWTRLVPEKKVVIVYDTMYSSTERMAREVYRGASDAGCEVVMLRLRENDLTRVADELLDAAGWAVGSPTLNEGMMPTVGGAMTYMKGLMDPADKPVVCFGSHGWNGKGVDAVNEVLKSMNANNVLEGPLKSKLRPNADQIEECYQAGLELGRKAIAHYEEKTKKE